MLLKRVKIRNFEVGLVFRDGEFKGLLGEGTHWMPNLLGIFAGKLKVEVVSRRNPLLQHDQLDVIVKSGAIDDLALVIDLKDRQRGLVWIDGRFTHLLPPGQYVFWNGPRDVSVQVVETSKVRFEHEDLKVIVRTVGAASRMLDVVTVNRHCVGLLYIDGKYVDTLSPGTYAFWKDAADTRVVEMDLRETVTDVSGQDIMTADKVTLRINALVSYRIVDPQLAVSESHDARQAIYRDAQLALRAVVGVRELDALLTDKDGVTTELEQDLRGRAAALGMEIVSVGIRDIILPGDMKDLMNRVTEAKKAAEANLISRREETAAIRSQANTAKLLADNPTLMRLRELEILEKIATAGNLQIMLGEKGLSDRVINLL